VREIGLVNETQQAQPTGFDTDDFQKDVIERSYSLPVLVDFWADWCGPCKILGPTLEKLARAADGQWTLAKIDTEKHRDVSGQYNIRNIPNVKLFVDGRVSGEFVGALPEQAVAEWLQKNIPSKQQRQVESAGQLLRDGRASDARKLLEPAVAAEPTNEIAVVLLAQTYLEAEPGRALELLTDVGRGSENYEAAEAVRTLAGLFGRVVSPDTLPEAPVRELYAGAASAARSGDYAAALSAFIEVVRKDRGYDDDGARKACIAIFKLLGEDSPVTRVHRPALGSALY
jgi:putative thioredoxin